SDLQPAAHVGVAAGVDIDAERRDGIGGGKPHAVVIEGRVDLGAQRFLRQRRRRERRDLKRGETSALHGVGFRGVRLGRVGARGFVLPGAAGARRQQGRRECCGCDNSENLSHCPYSLWPAESAGFRQQYGRGEPAGLMGNPLISRKSGRNPKKSAGLLAIQNIGVIVDYNTTSPTWRIIQPGGKRPRSCKMNTRSVLMALTAAA